MLLLGSKACPAVFQSGRYFSRRLQGRLQLDTFPDFLDPYRLTVGNMYLKLSELHTADHPDEFFLTLGEL